MDKKPVYSPSQVALAGFLTGPVAPIFFIKKNFHALGDSVAENKTLLWGSIAIAALLAVLPFLPEKFPNAIIPVMTVLSARTIVQNHQFTKEQIEKSDTYTFQSNWRVAWLSLIFLILFVALFFAYCIVLSVLGVTPHA